MRNIEAIKKFRKAHEQKANGNVQRATETMSTEIKHLIAEKKLDPKNVSFRALLEGLTDFNFGSAPSNAAGAAMKLSEAIVGTAFPTITNTILNAVVIPAYELYSDNFLSMVSEGTARVTGAEKIAGTTALGDLKRRLETHAYQEDEFGERDITIYKGDFGKIISLTFESLFNDETNMIMDRANSLGEIAGQHMHKTIVETIEGLPRTAFEESVSRAFTYKDTAYTADEIYSADHSAIDGVVNENTVIGGITETGLTNAYNSFATRLNTRGQKIVVSARNLLIHQLNEIPLSKLLKTTQEYPTGTADATTQINPFGPAGSINVAPKITPFLSDATWGYLGDFAKALIWLWVERPNTVTAPTDTNLAFEKRIVYRARFNYFGGAGLRDYRYITRIKVS